MPKAMFWERRGERVKCNLCPRACVIPPGGRGVCHGRANREGELESLNFGAVTSMALDPIEKKPLYHFHPGREVLSLGTFGCNLTCRFCQNHSISQVEAQFSRVEPEEAVQAALEQGKGCIGLAFTYSEPTVWYEFILETARLAHRNGLSNVLVSNGYIMTEPLEELLPHLDAANIDIKAFSEEFYRNVCGGTLQPVLNTVKTLAGRIHLELTTLIIPGLNDGEDEISRLVDWVSDLPEETPLHFSRYFPSYRMTIPPTPRETLIGAHRIAATKLHYVYLGNIDAGVGNDTLCPKCGSVLIHRHHWEIRIGELEDGKCTNCGRPADIVGAP